MKFLKTEANQVNANTTRHGITAYHNIIGDSVAARNV